MSSSSWYSRTGPLGAWTPVAAFLLNGLGVLLAIVLYNLVKHLMSGAKNDLHKIPMPPVGDIVLGHVKQLLRPDYHRQALEVGVERLQNVLPSAGTPLLCSRK
jgi:hypothetical protein